MLLWFLGGSSFPSDVAGLVGSGCVFASCCRICFLELLVCLFSCLLVAVWFFVFFFAGYVALLSSLFLWGVCFLF
jgi:hypothetical protein